MSSRIRQWFMPGLFLAILINLASSGFFQVYWLKDNQWSLDPRTLNIQWLSATDYRALRTATGSRYTTADGRTLVLTANPDDRKLLLSLYKVGTPDGQWHGWVTASLPTHSLHTWLGTALPVLVMSVIGLVVSLSGFRSKKPVATGLE